MKKGVRIFLFIMLGLIIICSLVFIAVMVYDFKKDDLNEENEALENAKTVTQEDSNSELSLIMVGDCLIHEALYNAAKQSDGSYDFNSIFTQVAPIISSYDLAFYNQESILGGEELGLSAYPRFNSPYSVGDAMINAGFNLVSLANNHTLDRGSQAIDNSLAYWKSQNNVVTAGSYSSFEERDNIAIYEVNNISYALLAYTTVTNGLSTEENEEYYLNVYDEEQVRKDISAIRDKVDLLLVSMHFGTEYTLEQTQEQEEIANFLASLNVDIIIGTHPHVIEPITYIGNTLVIYSLGNFISAQLTTDQLTGMMVSLNVQKENNQITFSDLTAQLVYTQTRNLTTNAFEFHVIPYSDLTDDILANKDEAFNKYSQVITSLGVDIQIK